MRTLGKKIVLLLLVAASLGAQRPAATLRNPTEAITSNYILQPSDLIKVQVFQEPDLEREVRVSQAHSVQLPLIGTVDVRNKSVQQAAEAIREMYDRDFLVNPQINVIVLEYNTRTVNVIGAVNEPGAIKFLPEQPMSLLDAISRAGGFNRLADRKRLKLTRTLTDGKSETFIINADELIQGNSNEPWFLTQGDVIFVPERIL